MVLYRYASGDEVFVKCTKLVEMDIDIESI